MTSDGHAHLSLLLSTCKVHQTTIQRMLSHATHSLLPSSSQRHWAEQDYLQPPGYVGMRSRCLNIAHLQKLSPVASAVVSVSTSHDSYTSRMHVLVNTHTYTHKHNTHACT